MSYSWASHRVKLSSRKLESSFWKPTTVWTSSGVESFEKNSDICKPATKTEALVPSPYRQLTDSHLSVQSCELSSEYRIIKYIILILRRRSKIAFFLTFRNQDANQVKYTALTALDGLMSLLV